MIKIVIDTNILISAALSPAGNPAKILAAIAASEDIELVYSAGILDEYRRVLAYPRLSIDEEKQSRTIGLVKGFGVLVEPSTSTVPLPDESDRIFYDTAKTSGATLITGNAKHFPAEPFIVSPADFVANLLDAQAKGVVNGNVE